MGQQNAGPYYFRKEGAQAFLEIPENQFNPDKKYTVKCRSDGARSAQNIQESRDTTKAPLITLGKSWIHDACQVD